MGPNIQHGSIFGVLGRLGGLLGALGRLLGGVGVVLAASWARLVASWSVLDRNQRIEAISEEKYNAKDGCIQGRRWVDPGTP